MAGDVTKYTDLITSQHADKPKFVGSVAAACQPLADISALYAQIPALYDVDVAAGQQLDVVGQWVGVSRELTTALAGVYFAFDTEGVGFDQGVWLGPYDPITGLVSLPDDFYRIVIKSRILNNHWNGSKEDAYTLANAIFSSLGFQLYIEDHSDLSIDIGLVGSSVPSSMVQALLTSGKFDIKPAGVRVSNYFYGSAPGKIFAFDINNDTFGGFDEGSWATVIPN